VNQWLRQYHPRTDAETVVVCFPHAGGSASYYRPMSAALPASVGLYAVQYPGRQDRLREPLVADVVSMAEAIAPAVLTLADRPLALFGHSMGASVAFEVGRRLERWGAPPVALFVSSRHAPSRPRGTEHHLADDKGLVSAVVKLGGPGVELMDDPEFVAMVLPTIRSDYRAAETYLGEPGATVRCPVVALLGDDDPDVGVDDTRVWAEHTTGEFTLRLFPGNHFYPGEHIETLADLVATRLATARA
jgi:surfactin synthase thioesterase subunit